MIGGDIAQYRVILFDAAQNLLFVACSVLFKVYMRENKHCEYNENISVLECNLYLHVYAHREESINMH